MSSFIYFVVASSRQRLAQRGFYGILPIRGQTIKINNKRYFVNDVEIDFGLQFDSRPDITITVVE